ncbi:MAG: HupE/UreJ family protein [Acidobacteria bacterium]|nr:MAG: HupE/UreJ family protein [Acidobacteriota bacterium]
MRLRADGRPIPLRVRFPQYGGPRPPAVEPSLLGLVARLEGQLPVGATRITFQASRAFPPVHLTILDQAAAGGRRELLEQGAESTPYRLGEAAQELDRSTVAGRYLVLGFLHILPAGLDHVLFVLGLFLLSARFAPLLWQISAFTVAHTLTLALSSYGLLSLPPRVVEPMIALSIAWVAVENVVSRELRPWRPLVVFAFGLLHGLGFAGVLAELGLPRQELATALLAFNAGVELGQLAVVALAFLAVGWARHRPWYRRRLTLPASALIAAAGLALFADRIAG